MFMEVNIIPYSKPRTNNTTYLYIGAEQKFHPNVRPFERMDRGSGSDDGRGRILQHGVTTGFEGHGHQQQLRVGGV